MKGLILDLRNNPGGLLDQAVSISDMFLEGGEVVSQREKLDWFEVKALFGWRVLIPRTQENASSIMSMLRRHGAVPMEVATISVEPPRTPQQIDRAITPNC
jgi:hypothetical protein